MAATTTTTNTDRDAAREKLLDDLAGNVLDLVNGDDWQSMLDVASKFHDYSLHNVMLIAMQMPDATRVAGYKTWQKLGRQVRKGQHGISIFAPLIRKVDDDKKPGEKVRRLVGFKLVSVFDISQTDGDDLPESPGDRYARERTSVHATVEDVERLHRAAVSLGVNVVHERRGDVPDGRYGWHAIGTDTVHVVDDDPGPVLKTLAHELGHRFDPDLMSTWSNYSEGTRADAEVVAEIVSWLVCRSMGVETDNSAATYLANWAASNPADKVHDLATRTITAARKIEEALFTKTDDDTSTVDTEAA